MAKIKVTSDKFTQSSRVALYDERLSPVEKVIVQALYDNTWKDTNEVKTLTSASLMKIAKCSNRTLYTALSNLEKYGYIRSRVQDTKNRHKGGATHYFMAGFDEVEIPVIEGLEWRFSADPKTTVEEDTPAQKQDTPCTNNCDTVETPKEETKVVRKPVKRDVSVKQDTPTVKKKLTRTGKQKPAEKPIFTRGYAASPTPLPPRGADVTEWSGYDGTALAERDGVRGKLKAGKRVYTILGKKYTFVMQDDGETVNFMASEPTANMLKYDVLKYLKVPDYRRDQWKTIIDTLRRN